MKEFLIEGIDIDFRNQTIKYNPNHQNNVDTSELINPTYYQYKDFSLISLFKRNGNISKADGNPLIYALKNINNWKIDSKDIILLLKQFIKIVRKIKPKYDTIIMCPSRSALNSNFLYRLNKIINADNVIQDVFTKLEFGEVYSNYVDWKSLSVEDEEVINDTFDEMGNYFSFKYIPTYLRKYIKKSMLLNPKHKNVEELINDKDVLILDDTIATGATVSEMTKSIKYIFKPKSLTVITLFSPLSK